jgi:predicted ATPase with chaperone activity
MFQVKNLFWLWIISWSVLGLSAASFGQNESSSKSDSSQISDTDLRAFARAYVDTQKIRQRYEPALSNTPDPAKSKPIQDEANDELKKALAKQNLSIEKYNRIYTLVNNDDRLRAKVLKMVDEERKKSA